MKAIILAGGEGTRLRPVSAACPKPMVRLFDRPVLEHSLELISRCGITEVIMTLRCMPEQIRSYFGSGERFGLHISYHEEAEPLGTAGGVRACVEQLGGEDALILAGDAVCDFDLSGLFRRHSSSGAAATMALTKCDRPLEYGLVLTGPEGRVVGFSEKPAWDDVLTDLVNTGIYVLSPRALELIPKDEKYDFARDLFPQLVARGELFAEVCEGSWCDIGSPEAYLACMQEVIDGRLRLSTGAEELSPGVFSRIRLPEHASILPPVYIGRDVRISPGAVIGPGAILGAGCRVGRGARVTGSFAEGCAIGDNCSLDGAIVLPGTVVGAGSSLTEGSVVGGDCRIGKNCRISERVLIWPARELPDGAVLTESLVSGALRTRPSFAAPGVLNGDAALELTPEIMLRLGAALAEQGSVAAAGVGGDAARIAVASALCGANAAGLRAVLTDAQTPAQLSFASDIGGFSAALFARLEQGELTLSFFGNNGRPLSRADERRLENAAASAERRRLPAEAMGGLGELRGVPELYCAAAAAAAGDAPAVRGYAVQAGGSGAANRALRQALQALGIGHSGTEGCPGFELDRDGRLAAAHDEHGRPLAPGQLTAALVRMDLDLGLTAVCPASAPTAIDGMGRVLRAGRDPGAEELLRARRYMSDGVFAVCRLAGLLGSSQQSLAELIDRLPPFTELSRRVGLTGQRGSVMRRLAESSPEFAQDPGGGLSMCLGTAHVRIRPCRDAQALLIEAEERDAGAATALLDACEARIHSAE